MLYFCDTCGRLLEMCSADEVARMNALYGADVVAGATAGALVVVDHGEVILDLDRALGTGPLALTAADTAVAAHLAHLSTLIVA